MVILRIKVVGRFAAKRRDFCVPKEHQAERSQRRMAHPRIRPDRASPGYRARPGYTPTGETPISRENTR